MNYNKFYVLLGLILVLVQSSFGQIISNDDEQNFNYSTDSEINHVITRITGNDFVHELNINKLQFINSSGAGAGALVGGFGSSIPDVTAAGWTFSVISTSPTVTYNSSTNQITVPYSECGEEVFVQINVTTDSGENVLGLPILRYEMACDFTLVQSFFNACDNEYVIQMNEISVQPDGPGSVQYPCRPSDGYALYLYRSSADQSWDSVPVNPDTNGDAIPIYSIDGSFDLSDLDIGNYYFYVENACGQTFPADPENSSTFPAQFTISEGYSFGAEVNFSGYECFEDTISVVDITLTSVAYPLDEWYIKNTDTGQIIYNQDTDITTNPDIQILTDDQIGSGAFSVENISFIIDGLPDGNYEFYFRDYIGCIETELFQIIRPLELDALFTTQNVTCPGGSDGRFDARSNFSILSG